MSNERISLEQFLDSASTVLLETEQNLQQLAQMALFDFESVVAEKDSSPHLQQISQRLVRLSEQSHALHQYLQNGLDAPLANDKQWSLNRVLQSQEEERTQLARELEDNIGQLLANSVFELASCRQLLGDDPEAMAQGLNSLQEELEQGLADIRWFIADLEPVTILGSFGLSGGLRRYLERFKNRSHLDTVLQVKANIGRLPTIIEVAIFRIVQEALSNVYHHAEASKVEVVVAEQDAHIRITVTDNGTGIVDSALGKKRKNLGLARMVDYAELLNGTLRIKSEPDVGTQVLLLVPYPTL